MESIILSVGIAHVPTPRRAALLRSMERSMGGLSTINAMTARYTVHPDPKLRGYAGIWPTMRGASTCVALNSTHHLVMQDDLDCCRDFLLGAKYLASLYPDDMIQLFSMRSTLIDKLRERHQMWSTCTGNLFSQAMIWPVPLLRQFLDWERAHIDPKFPNDDQRMSMFTLVHGIKVMCTTPSLVQHVGFNQSEIGHPATQNRIARWFLGDRSPLDYDWTVPGELMHMQDPGDYTRHGVKAIRESGYYSFTPTDFMRKHSRQG